MKMHHHYGECCRARYHCALYASLGHNGNELDNTRHNDNAFSHCAALFTVLHSVIMLIVVAPFKVI